MKIHARATGWNSGNPEGAKTLCGMDAHQPDHPDSNVWTGLVPLARFPAGITCANCLEKYYQDRR